MEFGELPQRCPVSIENVQFLFAVLGAQPGQAQLPRPCLQPGKVVQQAPVGRLALGQGARSLRDSPAAALRPRAGAVAGGTAAAYSSRPLSLRPGRTVERTRARAARYPAEVRAAHSAAQAATAGGGERLTGHLQVELVDRGVITDKAAPACVHASISPAQPDSVPGSGRPVSLAGPFEQRECCLAANGGGVHQAPYQPAGPRPH